MVRVLFVCAGNICRSPKAQGRVERVLDPVEVSSEGLILDIRSRHLGVQA